MPHVDYDPIVLQKFANKLYARANGIIFAYTLLGIVFGLLVGAYLGTALGFRQSGQPLIAAIVGAVVSGLIGLLLGQSRAFVLKVQAQTALCQVAIEENCRR